MPTRTHLAALIRADGRPVRQIERDNKLPEKALSYYISKQSGTTLPSLDAMTTIADALGVPIGVVTQACIRDSGVPIDPGFTAEQVKLINRIIALPKDDQEVIDKLVTALEERQHKLPEAERHATPQNVVAESRTTVR